MKRSRVLSIQPHAIRGGPAVLHLSFLEGLARLGHEVHAIVPERQALLAEYRAIAASVHELPAMPCVPRATSPVKLGAYALESVRLATRIAETARSVDADVIHTFNEAFPAGGLAARKARVPSVVQIIGMSIFQPAWVARAYSRLLDSVADRLICCLQTVKSELVRLGVSSAKLDVVYNSVDPVRVRSRAKSPRPVERDDRQRVGMVAGMDRRKGHLDFVAAAARVLRSYPETQFFVVGSTSGDDAYLAELRAEIERRGLGRALQLTGAVDRTEPWIASFDVHCLPSLTEALSIAGLEAMALSRPIVATRVGGNPELVDEGVTGLLCRAADPDDLASKVIRLLEQTDACERMGAEGRKRADRLFSIEENVRRLSDSLERARSMR